MPRAPHNEAARRRLAFLATAKTLADAASRETAKAHDFQTAADTPDMPPDAMVKLRRVAGRLLACACTLNARATRLRNAVRRLA